MKKQLATLLAAATVLSLAACARKEETTVTENTEVIVASDITKATTSESKAETSETAGSSESTAEETSDVTEPTEESSGGTDWKPIDMSRLPEALAEADIRHDLKNLNVKVVPQLDIYAVNDTDFGNFGVSSARKEYDKLEIASDVPAATASAITKAHEEKMAICDAEYDKIMEQFLAKASKGAGINFESDYSCRIKFYRCDDQVVSFAISNQWDFETFNFDAKTGEPIKFSDVVKDVDGFSNFVRYTLSLVHSQYNPIDKEEIYEVAGKILDEKIPFVLSYDGILLSRSRYLDFSYFKFSALSCPDLLDMSFFLNTPEYYVLVSDVQDSLLWDVNGDGKVDTVSFCMENGKDVIKINDSISRFDIENTGGDEDYEDYNDGKTYGVSFNLAYTPSGFYIVSDELIGKIGKDLKIEKIAGGSEYESTYSYVYDPSEYGIYNRMPHPYWDAGKKIRILDFMDPEGATWTKVEEFYLATDSADDALVTKIDAKCQIEKYADSDFWEDYTLPAGSAVFFRRVSVKEQKIYMEVLHPDKSENFIVRMDWEMGTDLPHGYNSTLSGHSVFDLFNGVHYGG